MEDRTMQAQYECMANIYPAAKTKEETQGIRNKRSHSEGAGKIKDRKKNSKLPRHCGRRKCRAIIGRWRIGD